mmetsp:Transcript_16057/g.17832  ORF Transcript_16057/g.17832 Transcript_16057/m.17832 type:complete len:231 (+) Transcript_16057:146-838(+)
MSFYGLPCDKCWMSELDITGTNAKGHLHIQKRSIPGTAGVPKGCRMFGSIDIDKVRGNLYVTISKPYIAHHGSHLHHIHSVTKKDLRDMREHVHFGHKIHQFHFGSSFPGMINPLEGYSQDRTKLELVRQEYFCKIVPTEYKGSFRTMQSAQYSVYNHTEVVDPDAGRVKLPGVFFKYEFSEMMMEISGKSYPLGHFVTRLCAVLGGVWVVLGMVYGVSRLVVDAGKKKA